ncbi:MAG TPA: NAD(+)/NADH kinase [Candidatus Acidoferrales bacterium]|jgi:NAD+ kinase|nr:NAD(+)/NADH kinase [Candidatus Acidoferrales bacterium]
MKRASIISKQGKPELRRMVPEVAGWLTSHEYQITADAVAREFWPAAEPAEREELIDKKPDFVVVLGGDGTLLATARNVARAGIPILGVNLGSLGFLTEIRQDEIKKALEAIDAGNCELSQRGMLQCRVCRNGKCMAEYNALNDIVMNQRAVARITDFEVMVNGRFVSQYKADGLIIATPTGSTAYSLAAGGPIVSPEVSGFLITPVASHALTNRPLVVRDTAVIHVKMIVTREQAYLTVDGQQGEPLEEGDIVECRKSEFKVKLFKFPERSFFDVLRTKLKWGER